MEAIRIEAQGMVMLGVLWFSVYGLVFLVVRGMVPGSVDLDSLDPAYRNFVGATLAKV